MPLILLVIIVTGCLVLYLVFIVDSVFGGEDLATSKAAISAVAAIIRQNHFEKGQLYDLGSARGGFVLKIQDTCPGLKVHGVDNSWLRIHFARARAFFHSGHPIFIQQDIFDTDVSKADVVFMFLDKSLMPRLEKKLLAELKPGSLAITNTITGSSHFTNWSPVLVKIVDSNHPQLGKLFVYAHP